MGPVTIELAQVNTGLARSYDHIFPISEFVIAITYPWSSPPRLNLRMRFISEIKDLDARKHP